MRPVRFVLSAAVVALLGLSWQTQRETNRRLDTLAMAVAARPAEAPAPPAMLPEVTAGPIDRNVVPVAATEVVPASVPRELEKAALPAYVIEPPDILTIEVRVRDRASGEINPLTDRPISGQHLVRQDGTVGLGSWGTVPVSGLTLDQARDAVRNAVARQQPGAAADGLAVMVVLKNCNSKMYYVVTDNEAGDQVFRFSATGSDTVLDAVVQVAGVVPMAGNKLWVSRPAPDGMPHQVLPVDWKGITQNGDTATNYQLLPGDRVYVKAGK